MCQAPASFRIVFQSEVAFIADHLCVGDLLLAGSVFIDATQGQRVVVVRFGIRSLQGDRFFGKVFPLCGNMTAVFINRLAIPGFAQ